MQASSNSCQRNPCVLSQRIRNTRANRYIQNTDGGSSNCNDANVFSNPVTGAGSFNVTCIGNFTGTLKARDSSGAEIVVNDWNFQVLPIDTEIDAYVAALLRTAACTTMLV